jgi:hypothetical protein
MNDKVNPNNQSSNMGWQNSRLVSLARHDVAIASMLRVLLARRMFN